MQPERFDSREWVALAWTRSLLRGNGRPDAALQERFEDTFTPDEQELVKAAVKGIFVVNLTSNTVRLWLERLRHH